MNYHVAWPFHFYVAIQNNYQNIPSLPFHLISFALLNIMDCWWEGLKEILTHLVGLNVGYLHLSFIYIYMHYIHGSWISSYTTTIFTALQSSTQVLYKHKNRLLYFLRFCFGSIKRLRLDEIVFHTAKPYIYL